MLAIPHSFNPTPVMHLKLYLIPSVPQDEYLSAVFCPGDKGSSWIMEIPPPSVKKIHATFIIFLGFHKISVYVEGIREVGRWVKIILNDPQINKPDTHAKISYYPSQVRGAHHHTKLIPPCNCNKNKYSIWYPRKPI